MENVNIFKTGVRIFRPHEVRMLLGAIPKVEYKNKFEALLFTGMRYNEMKWLYRNPNHFNGNTILLPSLKTRARHKERYVRLNEHGKRAVQYFLASKKNLPSRSGWDNNLKRWCKLAGIDPAGVCAKTTRKTWESWLVTMYPTSTTLIFLSQGHTDLVSMEYYLMLPFSEEDKQEMRFYTDGWI